MKTRTFLLAGLLVALLLVSFYASSHPDGLEYLAGETGFGDTAKDSPVAGSPLADYGVRGIENPRLSVGLAGVTGVLITLVIAGALGYAVRRRTPTSET